MPLVRNDLSLPPLWTVDGMSDFLRQAAAQAGMNAIYDEFDAGGSRFLVWERVTDATKTYGKFYYIIQVDSFSIRHTVSATYDRDGDSFPGGVFWSDTFDISASFEYTAISLRSDEAALVVFRGENNRFPMFLGWVRPINRPGFWNENSAPYVFVRKDATGDQWLTTERNPYQFDNGESLQFGRFYSNLNEPFPSNPNPIDQKIDVLTGLYLRAEFSQGQGIVGAFGPDWGRATDRVSLPGLLIATSNGHQYVIVYPSLDEGYGAGVARIV